MMLILGAGLSGLTVSHFAGHDNCLLLEKEPHAFGHVFSRRHRGFTWDPGPHLSFTPHADIRDLLARNVNGNFLEYPVQTVNHFSGGWVNHPAQSNLYQVKKPLRDEILQDFIDSRQPETEAKTEPQNYDEWLVGAFGERFTEAFSRPYTRKYWTTPPADLTCDWIGKRLYKPRTEDVLKGASGPLPTQTHYISSVRYPLTGGYQAFANKFAEGAEVRLQTTVVRIDLEERCIYDSSGTAYRYDQLVNTLPLPTFVDLCPQATTRVIDAAKALACSRLFLVNASAPHPTQIEGNWFYIIDEDKISTRINCTEVLSPNNAPARHTGIQVEVYASAYREFPAPPEQIIERVVNELCDMGFINLSLLPGASQLEKLQAIDTYCWEEPWANVIFDYRRREALDTILSWMEQYGLMREQDDLSPITDWDSMPDDAVSDQASLFLAGRFGQWKYFWSDDCILRGRQLGRLLKRAKGRSI